MLPYVDDETLMKFAGLFTYKENMKVIKNPPRVCPCSSHKILKNSNL